MRKAGRHLIEVCTPPGADFVSDFILFVFFGMGEEAEALGRGREGTPKHGETLSS